MSGRIFKTNTEDPSYRPRRHRFLWRVEHPHEWDPSERFFYIAISNEDLATIDKMIQDGFFIDKLHKVSGLPIGVRFRTPLIYAVLTEKINMVQHLLDRGADVLMRLEDGDTPLSIAVEVGNLEIVKLLVENGAKPTMQTAFLVAIEYERLDIVRYLLEKGVIVNWKYKNGDTPLSKSIITRSGEIATFLIDNGANLEEFGTDGYTPLGLSVKYKMFDVLKYLMQKGANIDQIDNKGRTALAVAASRENFKLAKYLIESGANTDLAQKAIDKYAANNEDFDIYVKVFKMEQSMPINCEQIKLIGPDKKERYPLNRSGKDSYVLTTSLKRAVENEDIRLVRGLLRRGADVLIKLEDGETLLSIAIKKGNLRMVKLLVENGAKQNMQTALLVAIENKNLNIVRFMVDKGVSINWKYKNGDTPLTKSIIARSGEIATFLLDNGANPGELGSAGYSPLGLSVKFKMFDVLKYLMQKGAIVDQIGNNGRTALAIAASIKDLRVTKYLIESGANTKLAQKEIDEYAAKDEDFDIYLKMYKMSQLKKKETYPTTSNKGLFYRYFQLLILSDNESESDQKVTTSATNQQWLLYRHF